MQNPVHPLLFVNVELTLRCNLRCLHCGSTAGDPRPDELDPTRWIGVMEQLASLGCREVCILGGEPFLTPGWFDIASAVCGLGMDLVIITNGWLIEPRVVKQLKDLKGLSRIGSAWTGQRRKPTISSEDGPAPTRGHLMPSGC